MTTMSETDLRVALCRKWTVTNRESILDVLLGCSAGLPECLSVWGLNVSDFEASGGARPIKSGFGANSRKFPPLCVVKWQERSER